jgi:spermidine synthase
MYLGIYRGLVQMAANENFDPTAWVTDSNGEVALSVKIAGDRLFYEESPFQTVEVFNTPGNGKMLTIDRMVMCTEKDEAAYHEMLVHVPMFTKRDVKNVLVIGAGDGGTIRELVRHPGIEKITMVEIDEVVVRASKLFFPTISSALEHPKLTLLIDDGIKFVANAPAASYDLVLIDSSDPVGPSEGLFSRAFYDDVHRILRPGGAVGIQSESPAFYPQPFVELQHCLGQVFGADFVQCYLVFITMYPTGLWSLTYCSKQGKHPVKDFDRAAATKFAMDEQLHYYNSDVHQAAFCLPNYIQKMING